MNASCEGCGKCPLVYFRLSFHSLTVLQVLKSGAVKCVLKRPAIAHLAEDLSLGLQVVAYIKLSM